MYKYTNSYDLPNVSNILHFGVYMLGLTDLSASKCINPRPQVVLENQCQNFKVLNRDLHPDHI